MSLACASSSSDVTNRVSGMLSGARASRHREGCRVLQHRQVVIVCRFHCARRLRHGRVQVFGTTDRAFHRIVNFGQVTCGLTRFDHANLGIPVPVTVHRKLAVFQMPMSCITEEFRNSRSSAPMIAWISGLSRKMNRPRSHAVFPSKEMVISIR